jgi:PAS domain S-box-containing protein
VSSAQWKADNRIFVTTIWRDVTERVVAENALKDSEARHRALAEALPQLVWICNGAGLCDYTNPQWQTYTGALPERSAGDGWLDFIHEEGRAKASSAWQTALETGTVFDADVRLRRKDQHYRWFKMRSIPVRGEFGNVSKWFGTATDITTLVEAANALKRNNEELEMLVTSRTFEREAALRQLHESQKMETIGQLTGGVAHDFNNLLAVILGSLSLLKKALPDDPRTSRLLEGAIQGAERGANLTKRLLAFARRQELKLSAVEVQKLIPDMQDFLRQSIGPIIKIILDIPSDVPPVKIDANQLELALMNLAVNARDAMSDGGTLTITCNLESTDNPLLPSTLAPGEYVRISVADTGQGMSEATLAKAMEPFFTTKGIGKGTGLGLSMVHGLTAQCGGAMQITSKPGRGTTVSLWLPRASREELLLQSLLEAPSAPEIKGRQLKILLVDDDALVSKNTTYMLHDLGHSVKEASSGSQALQLVRSGESFDLVLTDYAMPEMNGLDLAKEIKQLNPQLPVVIATGFADLQPLTTLSFPRLGKPYTQDQLAAFLESAVGPAAG